MEEINPYLKIIKEKFPELIIKKDEKKVEPIKSIINSKGKIILDLYHGTSTIFLNSIIEKGLGGINPVKEWGLMELCNEVYNLSEKYLQGTEIYENNINPFQYMKNQFVGGLNYQHGDTYLTPSKQTAIRYSTHKRYGSELLSIIFKFLEELVNLKIEYVITDLFVKYRNIYNLMDINPAPLLIQAKDVDASSLIDEYGKSPEKNFNYITECYNNDYSSLDVMIQQTNFRLKSPVPKENLKIWLINITKWDINKPEVSLYELII